MPLANRAPPTVEEYRAYKQRLARESGGRRRANREDAGCCLLLPVTLLRSLFSALRPAFCGASQLGGRAERFLLPTVRPTRRVWAPRSAWSSAEQAAHGSTRRFGPSVSCQQKTQR